jgi:hypothetical protein
MLHVTTTFNFFFFFQICAGSVKTARAIEAQVVVVEGLTASHDGKIF